MNSEKRHLKRDIFIDGLKQKSNCVGYSRAKFEAEERIRLETEG